MPVSYSFPIYSYVFEFHRSSLNRLSISIKTKIQSRPKRMDLNEKNLEHIVTRLIAIL